MFINETISEEEPIEGEIYETSQSINGQEQTQSVDMDVSTIVDTPIEENVPLTLIRRFSAFNDPATRNVLIQNVNPKRRLLQPGYEQHIAESMGVTAKFQDIVKEERFICNKGKILELFKYCDVPSCKSSLVQVKSKKVGSALEIKWRCKNGHVGDWSSCDKIRGIYSNNLLVASSVLMTGNQFAKHSFQCDSINLATISETTFNDYQDLYLHPAINCWWEAMKAKVYSSIGYEPVVVAGDGQMDSPGHCAKYCAYTLMHEQYKYILNMDLVDVREAEGKSACMEKLGCKRALNKLKKDLNVAELVTDANSQIIKMIAEDEDFKFILHQLDMWHKSIKLDGKLREV